MALYTPQSLPHTPASHNMNAHLPPLPVELLSTWSSWRPTKDALITPPLSNIPSRRVLPHSALVLPPIRQFHHDLARHSPHQSRALHRDSPLSPSAQVTPPRAPGSHHHWRGYDPTAQRPYPGDVHQQVSSYPHPASPEYASQAERSLPSPPVVLDWISSFQQQSSQFIAEKTCEMICYLWFSTQSQSDSSPPKRNRLVPDQQPPEYFPRSSSATASLQFSVSHPFVRFMQKVLETTQVSQSVIVLSLHYVYRMKARNPFTAGQAGSEYRVAVAALMMANKFVDDNTYTNKTWSEVSGIALEEVNRMEREFLLGIDFGLYISSTTYDSWLNLLKGLIMAKERDSQHWRRSWRSRALQVGSRGHKQLTAQSRRSRSTSHPTHRARSTSPSRTPAYATVLAERSNLAFPMSQMDVDAQHLQSGLKRSAADAFSPTSASFPPIKPLKRPMGLSLDIPEPQYPSLHYPSPHSSDHSASPMEPLQQFSKLSLGASPVAQAEGGCTPAWATGVRQDVGAQTLVSAYRMDDKRPYAAPQNLFFYALACSPLDSENARKGRLHYHQPHHAEPAPPVHSYPMAVQSASASPYDGNMRLPAPAPLPPFSEMSREWMRGYAGQEEAQARQQAQQPLGDARVPSAPFANAGPPGFQFYATSQPDAAHDQMSRSRGRRL